MAAVDRVTLEHRAGLHAFDHPGLQDDLVEGRIVDLGEVDVVEGAPLLGARGKGLGVRRRTRTGEELAPLAPWLDAIPGRHRAWGLPRSGVVVALETVEDEVVALERHRRDLLAMQRVSEEDLADSRDGRRIDPRQRRAWLVMAATIVFGPLFSPRLLLLVLAVPALVVAVLELAVGVAAYGLSRPPRTVEGILERKSRGRVVVGGREVCVDDAVHRALVRGVRYRVHLGPRSGTFEPLVEVFASGAPYRTPAGVART